MKVNFPMRQEQQWSFQFSKPSVVIYTAIKKGKSPAINCVCASMDNTRSQLPPPIFTWVLGIELKYPGLYGKCLYLSHLTSSLVLFKMSLNRAWWHTSKSCLKNLTETKNQLVRWHLPCKPADEVALQDLQVKRAESPTLSSGPNTHAMDHAPQKHTKLIITTELKKGQTKKDSFTQNDLWNHDESHITSSKRSDVVGLLSSQTQM